MTQNQRTFRVVDEKLVEKMTLLDAVLVRGADRIRNSIQQASDDTLYRLAEGDLATDVSLPGREDVQPVSLIGLAKYEIERRKKRVQFWQWIGTAVSAGLIAGTGLGKLFFGM